MSTDTPTQRRKFPRPSVVTLACVFIAVTAFLTLTDLISALMDWGSVDMQDELKPALRELHRGGFDPSMAELLAVLRWVGMVMIVFVVATLVFSVYALRGDRPARTFTTVFAVGAGFMSLALGPVGMVQSAMLFIAAGALWSPTASRWWRDEPELAPVTTSASVTTSDAATLDVTPDAASVPAIDAGSPITSSVPAAAAPRPSSVLTAGLVTILGSLAAAGFALIYLGVHTFARDEYVKAITTGPFKDLVTRDEIDLIMQVTFWLSIALLPLALLGLLGASALLARRRVGRITTLLWAWGAAFMGLIMFPLGILATAGAAAVIILLLRDDARAWTATAE